MNKEKCGKSVCVWGGGGGGGGWMGVGVCVGVCGC